MPRGVSNFHFLLAELERRALGDGDGRAQHRVAADDRPKVSVLERHDETEPCALLAMARLRAHATLSDFDLNE